MATYDTRSSLMVSLLLKGQSVRINPIFDSKSSTPRMCILCHCPKAAFVEPMFTICTHMTCVEPDSTNDLSLGWNDKPIPLDCHNSLPRLYTSTHRFQHLYMLHMTHGRVFMLSQYPWLQTVPRGMSFNKHFQLTCYLFVYDLWIDPTVFVID